jgi:hypothetical protein
MDKYFTDTDLACLTDELPEAWVSGR